MKDAIIKIIKALEIVQKQYLGYGYLIYWIYWILKNMWHSEQPGYFQNEQQLVSIFKKKLLKLFYIIILGFHKCKLVFYQ